MKYLIIIGIVVAVAILAPIATIWSLNTLFPILNIPLTFDTWMAAIILGGVFSGGIIRSNKS
jgi:Zn-dependent membrane protease YugP